MLMVMSSGVYSVDIDMEQQKVVVSGCVDSATLIKKLVKSGKFAEIWPSSKPQQKPRQNQNEELVNFMKDRNGYQNQMESLMEVLKTAPQDQQPLFSFSPASGFGRDFEDQLAFERYLKESMALDNQMSGNNANLRWEWGKNVGENCTDTGTGGFVRYEGNSVTGLQNLNAGIPVYKLSSTTINGDDEQHARAWLSSLQLSSSTYDYEHGGEQYE